MKNSFFLVIPDQQTNADKEKFYEPSAIKQWLMDLPTANPGLATRLFHAYIHELNALQVDAQFRLDTLELLRPSFKTIEDYLLNSISRKGFPKEENEEKIHQFLIAIEREYTIGYWIVVRDLTKTKQIGWFQGKTTVQAIQRVIKGLSSIIISHNLMYQQVPEWVWMDLHSLYRLSVNLKKENVKVADDSSIAKSISPADSYIQIILLSLADPQSLMPKEIPQVYQLAERLASLIKISKQPIPHEDKQCVILQDEDRSPSFFDSSQNTIGMSVIYLNLSKIKSNLTAKSKFVDNNKSRYDSISNDDEDNGKLPLLLIQYLNAKWSGERILATPFFVDRKARYFCIGLNATFNYQSMIQPLAENETEILATPISDRFLSCNVDKTGIISLGSLISFRKDGMAKNKRSLGVICHISQAKTGKTLNFALRAIAPQIYPVTFIRIDAFAGSEPQKALIFGSKENGHEKSYLVLETLTLKDFDILRLKMNSEEFPIILRNKTNIGTGYWKFECRRIEEEDLP